MVAPIETIDRLKVAAAANDEYQTLLQHIKRGKSKHISQVPHEIRHYRRFVDELIIICDGFAFKGRRLVIPK